MSNISDRFRSYRPELDTGWDIYGYLSHADFLNMRNKGAKWCQIYSSFAAIKHVQLMSISCQYVNPWPALVQPLARKGWRRPEPRDALGCRWEISAGMPRMKQGMRKEWNGEKREKSCWVEGGRGRTNMARYWMVPTQSHSTTIFHNVLLVGWPNWSIEPLKPRETAASSRLAKPSACRSDSARALARLRISRNAWRVLTNLCIKAPCGHRHNYNW